MERDYVDIRLIETDKITFIEIKMERKVKACLRLAIGQLLEYAHYPNFIKAHTLLVVGEFPITSDDEIYLQFIRDTYNLPLHYAQWLWDIGKLGPVV
jgi:hypothetical protein